MINRKDGDLSVLVLGLDAVSKINFFDNCHFVGDDYKNSNFSTAFVENSPIIGAFNYLKSEFSKKPSII